MKAKANRREFKFKWSCGGVYMARLSPKGKSVSVYTIPLKGHIFPPYLKVKGTPVSTLKAVAAGKRRDITLEEVPSIMGPCTYRATANASLKTHGNIKGFMGMYFYGDTPYKAKRKAIDASRRRERIIAKVLEGLGVA